MRKSTLLLAAVFCLSLAAISQTPRTNPVSPQLSTRLSHVDNDIFIFLGKRDNTMHLVWDELTKERVAYYVVQQSNDGREFHAVDSLHPLNLFDIYVNDYPENISYDNTFLYSTETGSGRFIYNDVLTPTEMTEVMLWYRIKIVTTKGYDIYTKKMRKEVNTRANPLNGSLNPSLNNSNLPAQFSGNGGAGNLGGNTNPTVAMRMVGCPSAQAPPVGYVYTGNFQIYYGQCCYWEEREYRLQLITAPCGDVNAWCCPNTGDCQPLAYDPCCVHTCGEYNSCSCHPWTCCDISNANIWIVYSSTDYTFDATVTGVNNASCNDFFNGSVTVSYNSGLPFIPQYNWDNGIGTGSGIGNTIPNLEAGIYSLTLSDQTGCAESLPFTISEPPALTSSLSVQNVTCFGLNDGYIDVSVSGGTQPYTYNWLEGSNQLTDTTQDLIGLGPGNYAVTVTDANGCVSNEFSPVLSPDEFTGVVTLLDLGCPIAGTAVLELCCYGSNTGSAVLALSGGTPPASLVWSNGATTSDFGGLTAGNYSVTAYDANGCSFSRDFTLGQPDEIILTSTSTPAACGQCNGSATINVSGGSGGYSWQWPPSAGNQTTRTATNLCAGSYTVIVNDLFAVNCFKVITVSVSNIGGETITTSKTDASCFGVCDGNASVSFNCSDGPCTVQWFDPLGTSFSQRNSVDSLCGGSYSVVVTNASGCITSETVDILQTTTIISNLSIINETCDGACDGLASAAPTGGTSPYTYQWIDSNGVISGASNNLLIDLCSGDYTLVVTDAIRCSASFPFTISSLNSLFAITSLNQYQCFNECSGSISVTPAGGLPPYSFQWFENGVAIPGETNFSLNNRCAGTYTVQITDANGCSYTTPDIFINEPAELTASISSTTDLTCTSVCSGSASVTASGGSGTLTYKWFNSFAVEISGETGTSIANLCAGNHFVEVTDSNGCSTGLLPFTINDINPLVATITATNVSCNGAADGTIDLEVSGGFSPYTFSWNGGAFTTEDLSGLSAGTYTVDIIDSSGCTITKSATITEPDVVSASITIKTYGAGGYHVSCFGSNDGQLTANVTGGTPPFTYQWDDPNLQSASSAIGLGLGTYSVTITDANGCTAVNSETLSLEPGPFTSDVSAFIYPSGFNVSCFGASDGSIDLTVTGGEPPFRYAWIYNGIADAYLIEDPTGVPAGTYLVNVVDTSLGCITRDTIILTEPSEIVLTLTPSVYYPGGYNVSTQGGSDGSIDLEASGGFPPYTYSWSNSETTQDISNLTAGLYECTVTDSIGCQVTASIFLREPGPSVDTIDITICEGDSAFAGGGFQTEAGTYVDSFLNVAGLDSVIFTNLSVLPASRTDVPVTICSGRSIIAGGGTQTQSGTYYDTLVAANGCDSIVATILTVTPPDEINTFDVTICNGDGYFVGGDFQTESGTYIDTFKAADGCDSIWNVTNLTVLPELITTVDVQICEGTGYFVGGALQTTSGTYYDSLVTSLGCDSVLVTNLTVLPELVTTVDVQICDGTSYFAGGAFQSESGTYYDTLTTPAGCDSIVVTNLTVSTSLVLSFDITNLNCNGSCNGSITCNATGGQNPLSFNWSDGQTTQTATGLCAGSYAVTVTDANGCQASDSATVNAFQEIEVSVVTQDLSSACSGNRMCELNFGDFPPGTILNEQYAAYGIHISGNAYGTFPDKVIIYNADGNGPDPDLETASGHVAIFPENVTDADGNGTVDVPNDQGQGGVMTITFDYDRTVTSFVFVDKERGVPGTAKAYDVNNNLITTVAIPNLTNGSVQTIVVNATGVRKLVFDYRDSGGVTDILLDCNPRCCDGSATATATGGNPPLTYSWSNGGTTATITGLCPGTYTVTVTDADGCTGTQTATIDDCELSVSSLTIVREHFGGDVSPFTEGMTISLDTLCPFNLRANLCIEPVGSVKFILNGATYRVEEYIPYALAGDNPTGDYHDWVSSPGSYTLEVIPYSGPHATGTAGDTFTSTFTVIGQSCNSGARLSSVLDLGSGIQMSVYPIPFNDQLIINMDAENGSQGTLRLMDVLGRDLISRNIDVVAGKNTIKLDMSKSMPDAVYFLEVRIGEHVNTVKVIKAE